MLLCLLYCGGYFAYMAWKTKYLLSFAIGFFFCFLALFVAMVTVGDTTDDELPYVILPRKVT